MEHKYLVVKAPHSNELMIFSGEIDHSWMARNHRVVSAGKFKIYPACPPEVPNPQVVVEHGSVTLEIERNPAREEVDQKIIEIFLRPRY